MIRAGSVGIRATYIEPYDDDGEETADTEWDEKGRNIISHIYVSDNNFITSAFGIHGYGVHDGIKSLTFRTNCCEHGPIGSVNDNSAFGFKVDIDPGIRDRREFGGFFGSYSRFNISSIGIYVSPIPRYEMVAKRENIGPSNAL